ncbi:MAG: rubredoxin, partial [Lentisphaeria bacterium]|nr:rubredoxin [Lentisphaeria bacterium]NQZ69723.1 rubredoxin [Lentisphaeria bacterium]
MSEENKSKSYVCIMCGYIYDPAIGDPYGGVDANTTFEALP